MNSRASCIVTLNTVWVLLVSYMARSSYCGPKERERETDR